MQPRQTARDHLDMLAWNFALVKIDEFRPESVGDCLVKTVLIDKAAIDHGLGNGLAVQAGFIQNVIRLRRLQDVLFDEKLGDLFVVHLS